MSLDSITAAAPTGSVQPFNGLRVLGFCDDFSPVSHAAAGRVAAEVYERLADLGAEVTVAAMASGWPDGGPGPAAKVTAVPLTGARLPPARPARVALSQAALRRAESLAASVRPHVLHANSLHLQSSLIAAVLTRRRSVPLVTTAHCSGATPVRSGLRSAARLYEHSAGRLILGRSAMVVAVARSVADHLVGLGVARARIEIVPNGVDHGRFFPEPWAGPTDRPTRMIVFGRLTPGDGPPLLQALACLARSGVDFETEVVGDGRLRARLVRRSGALGLGTRVCSAPAPAGGDRFRGADVVVLPSASEGVGLTVLEAMASGACVVAADAQGNAELIRHGVNGLLFPARDPSGLAKVLREVIADAGLRRAIATEARITSLAYSWESTARSTGRVLAGVAAGCRLQRWHAGAAGGGLGQWA